MLTVEDTIVFQKSRNETGFLQRVFHHRKVLFFEDIFVCFDYSYHVNFLKFYCNVYGKHCEEVF